MASQEKDLCRSADIPGKTEYGKKFSAYCDEWLKTKQGQVSEATYTKYFRIMEKHILPRLGTCPVQFLSTTVIDQFTQALLSEDQLSPKTINDALAMLRSLIGYTQEQVPEMPVCRITYLKNEKKPLRVLTREEQTRFIRHLLNDMDEYKFGALLSLLTGMKLGEVCALRLENVSLEEKTIQVTATMQRLRDFDEDSTRRTKMCISNLNAGNGARTIPLTDHMAQLCENRRSNNPEAFVLTGESGRYIDPRTMQYRIERYAKECGLAEVHFQTLRHTFATRCVEVDFEIKSLSEVLGYSNTSTVLDRYARTTIENKRNNMNKLADIGF